MGYLAEPDSTRLQVYVVVNVTKNMVVAPLLKIIVHLHPRLVGYYDSEYAPSMQSLNLDIAIQGLFGSNVKKVGNNQYIINENKPVCALAQVINSITRTTVGFVKTYSAIDNGHHSISIHELNKDGDIKKIGTVKNIGYNL